MKILISSPYRRSGLLYERWLAAFGKNDADVLVIHGSSLAFNPTLDPAIIEAELAKDRARAGAEYLAEWRDDISSFASADLVAELIDHGIYERPPEPRVHYVGFADESSGQGTDAARCRFAIWTQKTRHSRRCGGLQATLQPTRRNRREGRHPAAVPRLARHR